MQQTWRAWRWWISAGLALSVAGAAVLARTELDTLREAFETDARIAHRLLSQRVVQQDAVLATLSLLQPDAGHIHGAAPEQRLPALYPHIVSVQRRPALSVWGDAALDLAEARSASSNQPALADADLSRERYRLVMAAHPVSNAMTLDMRAMVPWDDWPMSVSESPVAVWLEHDGQRMTLQMGHPSAGSAQVRGWSFAFRKRLAADSQPFALVAQRHVGWGELPWPAVLVWCTLVWAGLLAGMQWQRQRTGRQRAEELLRLGQVTRLNTLGELAAGMAHELNQPLTAVLANTQAAYRLLDDDPPDIDVARNAMQQAADQARRAADVLGRLRRSIERPSTLRSTQAVSLGDAVNRALYLLEPEISHRQVSAAPPGAGGVVVQADPVALDQVLHNLLMNALQALEQVPPSERRLQLGITATSRFAELRVTDSGPGIAAEDLPRVFEPFFTTREGGLGLGLSLSESLISSMGGRLTATNHEPRGAAFVLELPLHEAKK
jgi:signal transduction histidine kinase